MAELFARAWAAAILALALTATAFAQEAEPAAASGPSFALEVRAPSAVKELLERHLELRRYREVSDLDDAELARLIVIAERNVRELVGTLGYFDPKISIRREGAESERPVIVVEVDPGQVARVGEVKIDFEGDIAQSSEAVVAVQRDEIRNGW